jgi:cholest-4-en-3-one 26-monooxygenase
LDIDLVDPDTFLFGPPHSAFATLRDRNPVFLHRRPELPPFWVVTRHADVVRVSEDWNTFSSAENGAFLRELPHGTRNGPIPALLNLDPPEHTRLRERVRLDLPERRIRALCNQILDRALDSAECDFATDVAAEFSLAVLAEMLGFPDQADRRHVRDLVRRLADPLESPVQAVIEMGAFAREIRGASALSAREFENLFVLLVVVGHLTTQYLLSGGMLAFIEHPAQWREVVASPGVLTTGVDEVLRWVSPVMQLQRTAMRDTAIGDQPVAKGDRVALYYIAANRDPAVFRDPDTFLLTRTPNPHVSLGGGGPHHCLGSNSARLQVRVFFEELARRVEQVELTEVPAHLASPTFNGISVMPVRFVT